MMDFSVLIAERSQYFWNIKLNLFSFFYLLEKENWFEIFLMLWIAKRDGELSDNIKCSLDLTYKINRNHLWLCVWYWNHDPRKQCQCDRQSND